MFFNFLGKYNLTGRLHLCSWRENNMRRKNRIVIVGVNVSMDQDAFQYSMQEMDDIVQEVNAMAVVFDGELLPTQIRNLEKVLDCEVIGRTILILEIFAKRVKTRESKLQVEVARLKYMLPRLVDMHESLGRQRGGAGIKKPWCWRNKTGA